jgi:erythrin-vacuolar iron transport family protein
MKRFDELTEREVLALAITNEEDDARIYESFADGLRDRYPATATTFEKMRDEENSHRHRLIELFKQKFGDHIPLIRRSDVRGFVRRRPVWLVRPLGLDKVRGFAAAMEAETRQFYEKAAQRATDASVRQLLGDLAAEERSHAIIAEELEGRLTPDVRKEEDDAARKLFVLQVIQPGLAGLMDGSVSTLAPLFAAAFATHNPIAAFRVGLAASIGAGISMGFAEALSDDGALTGRGHPWTRGFVCGLMTTAGGIGHTLPYLIRNFKTATTVAVVVVCLELATISWIRNHYMDTPLLSAAFQVIIGGVLVLLTGIFIGM